MTGQEAFEERFGFKARGEFRCTGWFEIPMTILGIILAIPGLFFVLFLFNYQLLGFLGILVFVPVWAILCWWLIRIGHIGVTYHYEADEKEFRIINPDKHSDVFYYPDVVSVDYKPIYYINRKIRGYRVTVTTKYLSKKYDYIFSDNRLIKTPQGSPFFILEQRSGLADGYVEEGGATRT